MTPPSRELGLPAAIAIVVGEAIALGIFLTPATMAKSLGSPLLVIAIWLGMAFMAMCGALCYSELAVRFPQSGGEYVYLREAYGERVGFLYGWVSCVVMYPGIAAALSVGAAAYITQLVPSAARTGLFLPAMVLCLFGAINFFGTRLSGGVMSFVNLLKMVVLFALVAWALFSGRAHLANLLPLAQRRSGSGPLFPAVAGAAVSAFFSFGGWWEASKIAGEVKHSRKTLPLAFCGGVALVTLVYVLISISFIAVVPIESMHSDAAFVSQFATALFGSVGAKVLSVCVLLCVSGGLAALTMAAPRVTSAMAQSGSLFPAFGRLHSRFGTPANAILLQTVLALTVLLLGAFDRVLSYVIFSAVIFLAVTVSTVFRLHPRVRVWWHPVAPICFLLCAAAIAFLILMHDPLPALLGIALVLCGLPVRHLLASRFATTEPVPSTHPGA